MECRKKIMSKRGGGKNVVYKFRFSKSDCRYYESPKKKLLIFLLS